MLLNPTSSSAPVPCSVRKVEAVATERKADKRRDQDPRNNNRNNPYPANDDNRDRRRNRLMLGKHA